MTQYGAKQYTKWLSKLSGEFYRLPSEAEWEYACRANSTTAFHYGDDPKNLGAYAWFAGNANQATHKVGKKKPNRWGLYDMHGNVSEWVLDQFAVDGYRALERVRVAGKEAINWPSKLYPRVVRGGSWDSQPEMCRSASRVGSSEKWKSEEANIPQSPWWLAETHLHNLVGFRIVRPMRTPPVKERVRFWDADVQELRDDLHDQIEENGRGSVGLVDPKLPEAIKRLKKRQR